LKQIDRLKGERLSVAQQLARWRELTAREQDLPRNWLLKDALIIDLARQLPDDAGELKHVRGLSDGTRRRHGDALIELIRHARNETPQTLPAYKRKQQMSVAADAAVDLLAAVVKLHAEQLQINPAILAPRKALEDLLRGNEDGQLSKGWRNRLIGEPLRQLLNGESRLGIDNGAMKVWPSDP